MKERIAKYLLEAGKGISAARILGDVLNIRSPDARSSDNVLSGFLGQDRRFAFTDGLWHLRPPAAETSGLDFDKAVLLHVQSAAGPEAFRSFCGAVRGPDGHLREVTAGASARILGKLRSGMEDHPLIVWSGRELWLWNAVLRSHALEPRRGDTLYLRDMAARALDRIPSRLRPEDLAAELGVPPADEERPREIARYLHACWLLLLDRVPAEFRRDPASLREWIEGPATAVDFSRFAFGPAFLRQLPSTSGVYIMKDRDGAVLYVGKSRNLKRRVSSYFAPRSRNYPKIARIHDRLHLIEVRETANEVEALLTEMRLIRKYRPPINLQTEVHERHAGPPEGCNLLLFVAGAKKKGAKIYFFRGGVFAGRHAAQLGCTPSGRLLEKVRSLYFTSRGGRRRQGESREKEIVFRWFAANRERLNYLDIDEAGDLVSVVEQLSHYLCDPDGLTRKVYYR